MHLPLLRLAAVHGTHGRFPSPVTTLLIAAGIGRVMRSRMLGQSLQARRLVVLPAVFVILGITDLTGKHSHFTPADVGFLIAGGGLSVLLGAARGATIELSSRDGELWQRYRPVTVALWLALIAAKLLLTLAASAAGAPGGGGTNGLLLLLGLSLAAEAAVIRPRALATGVPFARPEDDDHSQSAHQ